MLTLLAMNPKWEAKVVDVEGAFLQGKFTDGEKLYIEITDSMEKFYGTQKDNVLLLNMPIYGTKQAASCFYKTLVKKCKKEGIAGHKVIPVCTMFGPRVGLHACCLGYMTYLYFERVEI